MENTAGFTFQHEGDTTYLLDQNEQPVGEISTSDGGPMAQRNAKNLFGGVYQGEPVRRTNGIIVEDEYQGSGWGQKLYLAHMAQFPNTWFYNSQSWPPATNALKTLSNKGLIELHWSQEPNFDEEGRIHMSRLTPKGTQEAKSVNQPKPKPDADPEPPKPGAEPMTHARNKQPTNPYQKSKLPLAAADPHF